MATLDELVHYCKTKNPVGAFMLTGEWGSGKTYLIENELAESLEDTHVIARVSLFGLSSIEALHNAVKEAWIAACSPLLGKLVKEKERVESTNRVLNALNGILKGLNPAVGTAADLVVSMDVLDVVTVEPEIEDIHAHEKKRVVLVFDDLERSSLDPVTLMGAINNYCENQKFNTIIVTNEAYLIRSMSSDLLKYQMLKGKTVSRTVFHIPDYESAVSGIIEKRHWNSDAYKNYLRERKEGIIELVSSGGFHPESVPDQTVKTHNLLALTASLDDFYRIYSHLEKAGAENPDSWLFSFLAYALTRKGGVFENGELRFDCADEEIRKLYPMFSPEFLLTSIRNWVSYGIWDRELFEIELAEVLR